MRTATLLIAFMALALPCLCFGEDAANEYLLGPGDLVEVRVLGEETLSGKVPIAESGKVDYPVLGGVQLGGLSAHGAAEHLTNLLAECCLKEPDVVVFVAEYQSHTVEVLGSVGKPGPVVLEKPTRLLEALSLAGGLNDTASQEVSLLRESGEKIQVDLYTVLELGKLENNVMLRGGDVLFVPKAQLVSVTGEVRKNSQVAWKEGMTVVQAIAEAGGMTENAAARRVQVVRKGESGQEVFRVNLRKILRGRGAPFLIQPGDVISVPRTSF